MMLITDNIAFAVENGFGNSDDYSILYDNLYKDITGVLFGKKKQIFSSIDSNINFWNLCFITDFSENSQFDAMLNLAQERILPDKILCLAGSGKKFHGFHQRKWEALKGNIHLTAYLKPNRKIKNYSTALLILAAISVINTIDDITELKNHSSIKWVNDILIKNSKVSGVLAHALSSGETLTDAILGIGLNVETKPIIDSNLFIPSSACLNNFLPVENKVSVKVLLPNLFNQLANNYNLLIENNYSKLFDFYKKRLNIFGKHIVVMTDERDGTSKYVCEGTMEKLGENLELYISGRKQPVTSGRIILKEKIHV